MTEDQIGAIWGFIGTIFIISLCCSFSHKQAEKRRLDYQHKKNIVDKHEEQRNLYRKEHNLQSAQIYQYVSVDNSIDIEYVIDIENKQILVSDSTPEYLIIPFNEIIGCEIIVDNAIAGSVGIGRAVAGGILAGGSGAVVGALTNNEKIIKKYHVVIYRNNLQQPRYVFRLINKPTDNQAENNQNRKRADRFSQNVNASIKAIISQNTPEVKSSSGTEGVSERLKKLDNLKNTGLISEQEYNTKRQKILDDI